VTSYITSHPDEFTTAMLPWSGPKGHRWTVDEAADLELVRAIVARLPEGSTSWRDVVAILDHEPELRALNASVQQRALRLG
jgi:spore coat polysaccharide biosynthesis protein SpsF